MLARQAASSAEVLRAREGAQWAPLPGSQTYFLASRVAVPEVLYEGTRGPGKTDALLMDFVQDVGRGWGPDWRGVLFRRTYPELGDVITKSKKWFPRIIPGARYNETHSTWRFPDGEELLFRHFLKQDDYEHYHGHAYPWVAWEELTSWPDPSCYLPMFSCVRSTRTGMPTRVRATTNPYGVGHNWVKTRWRLPGWRWRIIEDSLDKDGQLEAPRLAIPGHLSENTVLMEADPRYVQRLRSGARNRSELRAWLYGDWDIVAGGMFDDVWDPAVHVVPPVPASRIPRGWRVDRSFDWGSSRPFSVGWWLTSNGEPLEVEGHLLGRVRGDLIRFDEWYGWTGVRNEGLRLTASRIAQGIREREAMRGLAGRVKPGPADTSIFDEVNAVSIARDMAREGVRWERADKGPGTRHQGWEAMRKRFEAAKAPRGAPREEPGLFVSVRCDQWLATVPVLSRSDVDLDDVDPEAEDHAADETRYRVRWKPPSLRVTSW